MCGARGFERKDWQRGGGCPASQDHIEKAPMPKVIEGPDGHYAVEIAPGVRLVWWQARDVWSVKIEGPADLAVRSVKVEPAVH
jgi:hypothetical protein